MTRHSRAGKNVSGNVHRFAADPTGSIEGIVVPVLASRLDKSKRSPYATAVPTE
jgi:hypothetical protein